MQAVLTTMCVMCVCEQLNPLVCLERAALLPHPGESDEPVGHGEQGEGEREHEHLPAVDPVRQRFLPLRVHVEDQVHPEFRIGVS